jgi:hypothetical protein
VREFEFELRLSAHLEQSGVPGVPDLAPEGVIGRQLGTSVAGAGGRVMDLVYVEPGPAFEARQRISPVTIPPLAIESDVGVGRFRRATAAIDAPPEVARRVAESAIEAGFFERSRNGQLAVRQATRYPDWFGALVGVENKPDLDRPGDLTSQLRRDVSLGVLDAVVLATGSYVTGAHLNRLPDAIGVWQVDLDAADPIEVVREPTRLDPDAVGLEVVAEHPGRIDVEPVSAAAKRFQRRRIAERAYGKGWRTFDLPGCVHAEPRTVAGTSGLPGCSSKDRLVDPGCECGPDCPAHEAGSPPAVDLARERERRTAWVADPPGLARKQANLEHFCDE